MKRYTIGLITLLLIVGCGKKDGLYTTYRIDGNTPIVEQGNYKDGEKDGVWTMYYDREKEMVSNSTGLWQLVDDLWIDLFYDWERTIKSETDSNVPTKYLLKKRKREEGNYKDGEKDGVYTIWYTEGYPYTKYYEGNYKNGKRDGKYIRFHYNGQKEEEETYKDGKEEGLNTLWYENGQKKSEVTYKNGKLNGLYTSWYSSVDNETQSTTQLYKKDRLEQLEEDKVYLKEELVQSFSSLPDKSSLPDNYITAKRKLREDYNPKVLELNDEILKIKQEVGDLKVGLIDQKRMEERTYKDGEKIGVWTEWGRKGGIKSKEEWFENGRSISYKSPSSSSSSLTFCDCNDNYGSLSTSQKRECDQMADQLSISEAQMLILLNNCKNR